MEPQFTKRPGTAVVICLWQQQVALTHYSNKSVSVNWIIYMGICLGEHRILSPQQVVQNQISLKLGGLLR